MLHGPNWLGQRAPALRYPFCRPCEIAEHGYRAGDGPAIVISAVAVVLFVGATVTASQMYLSGSDRRSEAELHKRIRLFVADVMNRELHGDLDRLD